MSIVCVTLYEMGLIYMTWNYEIPCNGVMLTAIGVTFCLKSTSLTEILKCYFGIIIVLCELP